MVSTIKGFIDFFVMISSFTQLKIPFGNKFVVVMTFSNKGSTYKTGYIINLLSKYVKNLNCFFL